MTEFLKTKNQAVSTLASGISDTDTSLTVATGEGSKFPSSYPFHITIDDEILSCTNRVTDVLTVTRAAESTAAAAHDAGAVVSLNITAEIVQQLQDHEALATGIHGVGADYVAKAAGSQYTAVNRAGDGNLGQEFYRGVDDGLLAIAGSSGNGAGFVYWGKDHASYPGQIWIRVPNAAKNNWIYPILITGATDTPEIYPVNDNLINLGKAANRWSDLRATLINGADLGFEEETCLNCGEKFKVRDVVKLIIVSANEGIRTIPVHDSCVAKPFSLQKPILTEAERQSLDYDKVTIKPIGDVLHINFYKELVEAGLIIHKGIAYREVKKPKDAVAGIIELDGKFYKSDTMIPVIDGKPYCVVGNRGLDSRDDIRGHRLEFTGGDIVDDINIEDIADMSETEKQSRLQKIADITYIKIKEMESKEQVKRLKQDAVRAQFGEVRVK